MTKKSFAAAIRLRGKRLLFPGLDLHTRCRYRFLPRFFLPGNSDTLDAGCGNGALSYQAYKLGNRVLGIANQHEEVERNRAFFKSLDIPEERLSFRVFNLYDLPKLGLKFNQIICSETLEHIRDDKLVIRNFYDVLLPGGVLHLCSPYALHPVYAECDYSFTLEDGGHLRAGYTIESYRALLEPAGFRVTDTLALGTPMLISFEKRMSAWRARWGDLAVLPFFILTLPFQLLDHPVSKNKFSLYVKAVKDV
jgi:SAM-dependent methyltransferase